MNESLTTVVSISPGSVIKAELKARGMKQKTLAELLGMQASHVSEIIKGERAINDQVAAKLEDVLHIPAIHWIRLQYSFDRSKKELEKMSIEDRAAEIDYDAYDKVCDMRLIMKKLAQDSYAIRDQISFCRTELGFLSPAEMQYSFGRFHKSEKTGLDARMINTWAILARYSVKDQPISVSFEKDTLDNLSEELREIFNENINTEKRTADTLSRYGIRFNVVKKLDKASIDGYSFYCTDGAPAIVVTKRFDRIDNFAFAVMHEVGHLALHKIEDLPIISISGDDEDPAEDEANVYAAEKLIPQEIWKSAPEVVLNPFVIQKKYTQWASEKGLNKWIVLGRISHETGMYKFKSDNTRVIN